MNRKQTPSRAQCPTCDLHFEVDQKSANLPFCSQRCRLIDLGRWLNEEIVLPVEEAEEAELEEVSGVETGKPVRLPPGWHDA
ncbi:MAG: DNA gyrase inhibitor YacG [Planctomycetota bacterium]|nr:MAG: DNA gyrase inhibitor YacG [Planctomycetota bacterium]